MNLMDIDANDEIPSAQVPPTLPTPTPPNQSSSSTQIDANTNASTFSTPIDANTNAPSSSNVLPSTSTNTEIEDSSKSTNKPASANPSGILRGRKPYPRDANGNMIRPEKENQKTGQKHKK